MLKIIQKKWVITFVFIPTLLIVFTNIAFAEGDGGQAGAFLRYGAGARALGMGRAYVTIADDATGLYWNPAGMTSAKRFGLTSMYSNLYYDSQYMYLGGVFPCISDSTDDAFLKGLLGPHSAIGVGFVRLGMDGFEQRSNTAVHIGDFGMYENAFLLAWANEFVRYWGILRYGFNLKFLNRGFPGLQSYENITIQNDWTQGLDFGMIYQPIDWRFAPASWIRYLIPLRFGFSLQNIIQPSWNNTGNYRDKFPFVFRGGLSYRFILKDYFNIENNSQILAAFDLEKYKNAGWGSYFGLEGLFPISSDGTNLSCRVGTSNRSDNYSFGLGFMLPLSKAIAVQIDYAYGFHPFLNNDSRFSLNLQFAGDRGAGLFKRLAESSNLSTDEKKDEKVGHLLRVISEYPEQDTLITDATLTLFDLGKTEFDTSLTENSYERFMYLASGRRYAKWLLDKGKETLRKGDEDGRENVREAGTEFEDISSRGLDYVESLILTDRMSDALQVLQGIKPKTDEETFRFHYLKGIAYKESNNPDSALTSFIKALHCPEEILDKIRTQRNDSTVFVDALMSCVRIQGQNSIFQLSLFNLGHVFRIKGENSSAVTVFQVMQEQDAFGRKLHKDYFPYPIYKDYSIADDVLYTLGETSLQLDDKKDALKAWAKIQRLFPNSDRAKDESVESQIENLIDQLQ